MSAEQIRAAVEKAIGEIPTKPTLVANRADARIEDVIGQMCNVVYSEFVRQGEVIVINQGAIEFTENEVTFHWEGLVRVNGIAHVPSPPATFKDILGG